MRIYGIHPVEEVLGAAPERVERAWIGSGRAAAELGEALRERGVACEQVDEGRLDELSGAGNHQGVVVEVGEAAYVGLERLIEACATKKRACLVVLDQVQDPQNLGAILRSAAAMGVDGVILPKDRAAGITGAVVRASAGQALRVPVARVTNLRRTLEELAEHGWWSVAAHRGEGSRPLWQIDLAMKAVVVLGSEGRGIRRLVAETCDLHAEVPMHAGVDSLNVASAAAVVLYEVRRQWAHKAV